MTPDVSTPEAMLAFKRYKRDIATLSASLSDEQSGVLMFVLWPIEAIAQRIYVYKIVAKDGFSISFSYFITRRFTITLRFVPSIEREFGLATERVTGYYVVTFTKI